MSDRLHTSVYQFLKPPARLGRQAKATHANTWRVLSVVSAILAIIIIGVGIALLVWASNHMGYYDVYRRYVHVDQSFNSTSGFIMIFGGVLSLVTLPWALDAHYNEIWYTKRDVRSGIHRAYFATSKDYSFKVVMIDEIIQQLNDKSAATAGSRLKNALDAYFANDKVIKADVVIRSDWYGLKDLIKRRKAKLTIIKAAEKVYASAQALNTQHLEDLKADIEHKFDERLEAIRLNAAKKVQRTEQLASR